MEEIRFDMGRLKGEYSEVISVIGRAGVLHRQEIVAYFPVVTQAICFYSVMDGFTFQ